MPTKNVQHSLFLNTNKIPDKLLKYSDYNIWCAIKKNGNLKLQYFYFYDNRTETPCSMWGGHPVTRASCRQSDNTLIMWSYNNTKTHNNTAGSESWSLLPGSWYFVSSSDSHSFEKIILESQKHIFGSLWISFFTPDTY